MLKKVMWLSQLKYMMRNRILVCINLGLFKCNQEQNECKKKSINAKKIIYKNKNWFRFIGSIYSTWRSPGCPLQILVTLKIGFRCFSADPCQVTVQTHLWLFFLCIHCCLCSYYSLLATSFVNSSCSGNFTIVQWRWWPLRGPKLKKLRNVIYCRHMPLNQWFSRKACVLRFDQSVLCLVGLAPLRLPL